MFKKKHKGQALLEFLIVIPSAVLVVAGALTMIYLNISHAFVEHYVYETLICVSEKSPPETCKNKYLKRIHQFLSHGNINYFNLTVHQTTATPVRYVKGELSYKVKDWEFYIVKSMQPNKFVKTVNKTFPEFR